MAVSVVDSWSEGIARRGRSRLQKREILFLFGRRRRHLWVLVRFVNIHSLFCSYLYVNNILESSKIIDWNL